MESGNGMKDSIEFELNKKRILLNGLFEIKKSRESESPPYKHMRNLLFSNRISSKYQEPVLSTMHTGQNQNQYPEKYQQFSPSRSPVRQNET